MAIVFTSKNPEELLKSFVNSARVLDGHKPVFSQDKKAIRTWLQVAQGYTHVSDQMQGCALMIPVVQNSTQGRYLGFRYEECDVRTNDPKFVYSYYHGHMLETMFYHFSDKIISATMYDKAIAPMVDKFTF